MNGTGAQERLPRPASTRSASPRACHRLARHSGAGNEDARQQRCRHIPQPPSARSRAGCFSPAKILRELRRHARTSTAPCPARTHTPAALAQRRVARGVGGRSRLSIQAYSRNVPSAALPTTERSVSAISTTSPRPSTGSGRLDPVRYPAYSRAVPWSSAHPPSSVRWQKRSPSTAPVDRPSVRMCAGFRPRSPAPVAAPVPVPGRIAMHAFRLRAGRTDCRPSSEWSHHACARMRARLRQRSAPLSPPDSLPGLAPSPAASPPPNSPQPTPAATRPERR